MKKTTTRVKTEVGGEPNFKKPEEDYFRVCSEKPFRHRIQDFTVGNRCDECGACIMRMKREEYWRKDKEANKNWEGGVSVSIGSHSVYLSPGPSKYKNWPS